MQHQIACDRICNQLSYRRLPYAYPQGQQKVYIGRPPVVDAVGRG